MRSRLRLAGLLLMMLVPLGCGTKPSTIKEEETHEKASNPWPRVMTQLRKEQDASACRRILGQLNADLATVDVSEQPAALSADQEKQIREWLNLTEDEAKEIRSATYASLDGTYLAQALILRDVVRSLDMQTLPPARQSELLFQWVCRQIVLNPWQIPTQAGITLPTLPPMYVLRRGSGSGLERAYIFLGLLQQAGIDGCLIGPPDAANRKALQTVPNGTSPLPRGPFWAVGVRIGGDIFLYDPWKGIPVPGPNGTHGTLAQVQAQPDLLKTWIEDKADPLPVNVDIIKSSQPWLAIPLNAAAPRMQRLESELRSDSGVRLLLAPATLRQRFITEAKITDPRFWNPTGDPFTLTRVLGSFLPSEEGGNTGADFYRVYILSLLPPSLFSVPEDLQPQGQNDVGVPEAVSQIRALSIDRFANSFLTTPSPRERIERGQFFEVAPLLVAKRKEYTAAEERIRTDRNREQEIRDWSKKARKVYSDLSQSRENGGTKSVSFEEAKQAVDLFWKQEVKTLGAIIDLSVAEAGTAESTYLLALCLHEQAVREQTRYERLRTDPKQASAADKARDRALDGWSEAINWWKNYEPFAAGQDKAYPGRANQAKTLAEQAQRAKASLR